MPKRRGNIALGGLLLASVGYMIGILTAPKSGKETRRDIQQAALRAKRDSEKKLKDVHRELNELVDQGKQTAKNLKSRAKTELDKAVASGQTAREKVRTVLSAIHEGESDDKDLQKALAEANKAVKHLKTFVRKHAKTSKTN